MDAPRSKRRPSVKELSKTPSWVMLGFLLGAAFVWTLRRPQPSVRTIALAPPKPAAAAPSHPRVELTTVEAVFAEWGRFAVWDNDVTQIALWDVANRDFSDYYEVRRIEGEYFFRSLSHLTNRIVRHGNPLPPECPVRFTETQEQYRDWLEHGRFERPPEYVPAPNAAIDSSERPVPKVDPSPRLLPPAPSKPSLPSR